MYLFLWILQAFLALHTAMGAVWKLSNPAQTIPSLHAIPPGGWLALSVLEVLCTVGLILPAITKRLAIAAPIAAGAIAAEMLLFSGLHLCSGVTRHGEMVYWLVVCGLAGFIAYGRLVLKPR